ncbi:MAG: HAD-IC family P-type ATPase, partial [Limisphaerales bacterium]
RVGDCSSDVCASDLLGRQYDLALLSGDHAAEEEQFRRLFGSSADLRFEQTPVDKLAAIEGLQRRGKRVAMIGDGLNDAGALRQSDVGMAVVQEVGRFSPASDVILAGSNVARIGQILSASRQTMRIVAFCLGVSVFYNAVGVTIAAAGWMSPVICAVVMPLSSVTVVLLASGLTTRAVRRLGFGKGRLGEAGKS